MCCCFFGGGAYSCFLVIFVLLMLVLSLLSIVTVISLSPRFINIIISSSIVVFYSLLVFFTSVSWKFPLVSGTLPSILADLNNAAILEILYSSSLFPTLPGLFPNLWGTVPSAQITFGITVIFMFYSFLSSLAKSKYLSLFRFLWFSLSSFLRFVDYHKVWSSDRSKVTCLHLIIPGIQFLS